MLSQNMSPQWQFLSRGVGQDDLQRPLPSSVVMWFHSTRLNASYHHHINFSPLNGWTEKNRVARAHFTLCLTWPWRATEPGAMQARPRHCATWYHLTAWLGVGGKVLSLISQKESVPFLGKQWANSGPDPRICPPEEHFGVLMVFGYHVLCLVGHTVTGGHFSLCINHLCFVHFCY